MVSGPVVGYFLGDWLDGQLDTKPYLMIILSVLGLVASIKETIKIIKRIAHDTEDTDNDF
jgi:F0F1-type ATP synthase assembly protein I